MSKSTATRKIRSFCFVLANGLVAYVGVNLWKCNSDFYKNYVMPIVHKTDPESAHRIAVIVSKYRLLPKCRHKDSECLKCSLLGIKFDNPVGIAAGFDKNGEAIMGLSDLGFGFLEIGSVTPVAQAGNEKPRVFRLAKCLAIINRYGFNNDGHQRVLHRLSKLRESQEACTIGVNLGKNKQSADDIDDYVRGVFTFGKLADYLVINISSPNTPGLRQMQDKHTLEQLLPRILGARDSLPCEKKPAIFLKLAPDLSENDKKDIAQVIQKDSCRVDGLIISNTTIQRPTSVTNFSEESGGLSGRPLGPISTQMIAEMYLLTGKKLPIIGVGGIFSGEDAYEKIRAGASLIQLYTALIYEGPYVVGKIKKELEDLLERDGFSNVSEAVGVDSYKYVLK